MVTFSSLSSTGLSLAFTVIYNSCMGFTNNIPNAKEWVPMGGLLSGVGGIIGELFWMSLIYESVSPGLSEL